MMRKNKCLRGKRPAPWSRRIKQAGRRFSRKTIVLIIAVFVLIPLYIQAGDIKGRLNISHYFSSDSGNFDFSILRTKLKLFKSEDKKSRLSFNVDGRYKQKFSDRELHSKNPKYDVKDLWMGYRFPGDKVKVKVGRQYIDEMSNSYVDGLNAQYMITKTFGAGVFGGLSPDKYDNSFNKDFTSFGIYGFVNMKDHQLSVGYDNQQYKGKTDREYFSFKVHSNPVKKVRFNLMSAASINQRTSDFDIDNVNVNLSYAHSKKLRATVFHNYYRSIKYYESAKGFIDNIDQQDSYYLDFNPQTRTGVRANYKLMKDLNVHGSVAYQRREIDDLDAVRYMAGIRKNNLFGFSLSGRYTYVYNFSSEDDEIRIDVSRNFFNKLDASLYGSYETETLDTGEGETFEVVTYGASLNWSINRHYNVFMFAERYDEGDYYNTSVFTQVGYRF